MLARSLDLLGGELVALDGAFFYGDASKASILTKKRLEERMAALDRSIAEYHAAVTANDQAEETAVAASTPPSGAIAAKLNALRQRRATAAADLAELADSGDGQLSRTDPDARLLAKHGQIVAGYNVQIAADAVLQLQSGAAHCRSRPVESAARPARCRSEVVNDTSQRTYLPGLLARPEDRLQPVPSAK